MTHIETPEPLRIPLAHSVRYVVRGLPDVPYQYGRGGLRPSEITLTYRTAPDSQLGRVHAYIAGRLWVDGAEIQHGAYGQHYDSGLDSWPAWLTEEARLHDPDASTAIAAPATAAACDGCNHPLHVANQCPVVTYGERCVCDEGAPATDQAAQAIWARYSVTEPSRNGLVMANPHAAAAAVLAVLPETQDEEIALLRLTVDAVEEGRRELRAENARVRAQLWTLAAMLEGFGRLLATSSRDWGQYAPDAWLYAVILGWDCEQAEHDDTCTHGAMEEMQQRHGWDDEAVAKARRYRAAVRILTEPAPAVAAQPPKEADTDRVVGYRSRDGRALYCTRHSDELGAYWAPVLAGDLPDGGICTYAECGRDVLIPQHSAAEHPDCREEWRP